MPKKRISSHNPTQTILNLAAEAGVLKSVRRSGWWMIGIKNGESVADHCFRATLLAYLIAKMEKIDPYPAVMMALLNDLHEARINDLHKVGHRYIDFRAGERKASAEQLAALPAPIRNELSGWVNAFFAQKSRAGLVARDADLLECMMQGKEYADQGRQQAIGWMKRPGRLLRTASAKRLYQRLKRWKSDDWWQQLVKLER